MAFDADPPPAPATRARRLVRAPRELAAGLCLLGLSLFALYAGKDLETGELANVGAGMLPRVTIVLLGLFGIGFVIAGFVKDGEALERWTLRGPLLVTLGVVGFALTIRSYGLAIAGPLVVLVGGAGSSEARVKELLIFAVVATLFSAALFRYLLGLPIPILSIGSFYL